MAAERAPEHDRGITPQDFTLTDGLLTKPVRATADNRVDLLDLAENVSSTRDAAKQALRTLIGDGSGIGSGASPIGFDPSTITRVRWAGARGSHDSMVAPLNVAVAVLLGLRTRGGGDVRAAIATAFVRALAAKAGMSEEQVATLEAQTANPALTGAVVAAVGAPVADAPAPILNSGGDQTVSVNVTRSPGSEDADGDHRLVPSVAPQLLLEQLARDPAHPAYKFALTMMGHIEHAAEATAKHVEAKAELELAKRDTELLVQEQKKEFAEIQKNGELQRQEHAQKLAEEEELLTKRRREFEEEQKGAEVKRVKHADKLSAITATFNAASEMKTLTPRLRSELSEQMVNALVEPEDVQQVGAAAANVQAPRFMTAKAYAERLSGAEITDKEELSKLRKAVAVLYQRVFKVAATAAQGQAREGSSMVCQFPTADLASPGMAPAFAKYRA